MDKKLFLKAIKSGLEIATFTKSLEKQLCPEDVKPETFGITWSKILTLYYEDGWLELRIVRDWCNDIFIIWSGVIDKNGEPMKGTADTVSVNADDAAFEKIYNYLKGFEKLTKVKMCGYRILGDDDMRVA